MKSVFHHNCNRRFFLKASIVAFSSLLAGPVFSDVGMVLPEGKLTLLNIHTNERLAVKYRNSSGEYDPQALKELNRLLRCHYTGQSIDMDTGVIEFVNMVDKKCGGNNEIQIISGYRSPEYNKLLISEGRHVVRNSLHMVGKAIDIRMPGVDLCKLKEEALKLKLGGVGYYRESNFVHLDSGRFRTW
ncbi:MAG TPA: DUF882 domain-containing protein [Dissulfurispiraceae bacterium]|nr:DUF882 domain-containing protein [Dissulfurispiraceae bacterium]